jgi:hypothetical protein
LTPALLKLLSESGENLYSRFAVLEPALNAVLGKHIFVVTMRERERVPHRLSSPLSRGHDQSRFSPIMNR